MEEKKQLYRASFCQTLSEVEAPTGEWKGVLGCGFVLITLGIWGYIALKLFGEYTIRTGGGFLHSVVHLTSGTACINGINSRTESE